MRLPTYRVTMLSAYHHQSCRCVSEGFEKLRLTRQGGRRDAAYGSDGKHVCRIRLNFLFVQKQRG